MKNPTLDGQCETGRRPNRIRLFPAVVIAYVVSVLLRCSRPRPIPSLVRVAGDNPDRMSELAEPHPVPDPYREENEGALYWFGEFCRFGMCSPQAEVLASAPGVDRHAVRDTLERGCDPDTAFLIFS